MACVCCSLLTALWAGSEQLSELTRVPHHSHLPPPTVSSFQVSASLTLGFPPFLLWLISASDFLCFLLSQLLHLLGTIACSSRQVLLGEHAVRLSCKLVPKCPSSNASGDTVLGLREQLHQLWVQPGVARSSDLSKEARNMDFLCHSQMFVLGN